MIKDHAVFLEKGINFRDQGGFRTKDGRKIKKGKLFRSGSLDNLTNDDLQKVESLNLNAILDYRDLREVEKFPNRLIKNTNYFHVPANPPESKVSANFDKKGLENNQNSVNFMLELYRELPFDNFAYKKLVELMKKNQSFVQHCAIGKDRTGIGSAIVLFILGADEDTVFNDYLMSDLLLSPIRMQLIEKISNDLRVQGLSKEEIYPVFEAREAYLAEAIKTIKLRYKTIENWLETEYFLDKKTKEKIKGYYLES